MATQYQMRKIQHAKTTAPKPYWICEVKGCEFPKIDDHHCVEHRGVKL